MIDTVVYFENNNKSVYEISAYFHHKLVYIHPFLNGNGRWARFVVNLYLKCKSNLSLNWPEKDITNEGSIRENYILALKEADNNNLLPLIELHEAYIQ